MKWLSFDLGISLKIFGNGGVLEVTVNFWYNPFLIIFISMWSPGVLELSLSGCNRGSLISEHGIRTEVWNCVTIFESKFMGSGRPGEEWLSRFGDLNGLDVVD